MSSKKLTTIAVSSLLTAISLVGTNSLSNASVIDNSQNYESNGCSGSCNGSCNGNCASHPHPKPTPEPKPSKEPKPSFKFGTKAYYYHKG